MKLKKIALPLAIVFSLALLYWPTCRWLVQSWISNPYYAHGFIIPLVSGFLVWTKRHELEKGEPSVIGAFVLAAGAAMYILGFFWDTRFLSALSLLIVLSGLALFFYGTKATRSILFPLCLLVFIVPLPFLDGVSYQLQYLSAHLSASLAGALGLPVTTTGAEIQLGGSTFVVGLPCSGMNTLISLLALVTIFLYLLTCPYYKKVILLALAFPIAILANVLRITSLLLVASHFGAEAATGFFHSLSSLLFFVMAFLCLVLLARILGCSTIGLRKAKTEAD